MNTFKIAVCGLLALAANWALAQKDIRPIPPEEIAKHINATKKIVRGEALLAERKIDEAIAVFREAVAIEDTYGYHVSDGSYALAKALTLAGRTEEALAAFKKAVRWDPKDRELHVNGPPAVDVKMDYAILLAKSGKGDEAKMVYYSAMRTYNYSTSRYVEPFPFLVVFDPDPDMTAWEYSADRFVAAAMMLKAPDMGAPEARAATEEVRRMEPTWVVPALFQASRLWMGPKRAELLQLAESLAKTDEEKAWVRAYQDVEKIREPSEWNQRQAEVAKKLAEIGVARRKASTVLRQSKLDLEKNHGKVAG